MVSIVVFFVPSLMEQSSLLCKYPDLLESFNDNTIYCQVQGGWYRHWLSTAIIWPVLHGGSGGFRGACKLRPKTDNCMH